MTHSLTTDFLCRYFNAALFADFTLITHTLVLSAKTFPVLCRSKYLLTEKSVLFGTQRAVVYSLRLCYLAVRPASYHFGRGKPDLYRIENIFCHLYFSPLIHHRRNHHRSRRHTLPKTHRRNHRHLQRLRRFHLQRAYRQFRLRPQPLRRHRLP